MFSVSLPAFLRLFESIFLQISSSLVAQPPQGTHQDGAFVAVLPVAVTMSRDQESPDLQRAGLGALSCVGESPGVWDQEGSGWVCSPLP